MPTSAFHEFLERYPAYTDAVAIDALRKREYARLDAGGHVYLDYTGAGICLSRRCTITTSSFSTASWATPIHPIHIPGRDRTRREHARLHPEILQRRPE